MTESRRNRSDSRVTILLLLVLLCQLVFILYCEWRCFYSETCLNTANVYFNSDQAAELVQSQMIAQQGGWIFAQNWYPSTEIRVLHVQLIMSLLFRVLSDVRLVWIITSAIIAVLITGSQYVLLRTLHTDRNTSLVGCLLLLIPSTPLFVMSIRFLYYGFFAGMTFLFLALYYLYRCEHRQWRRIVEFVVLTVVAVSCGLCGVRYFLLVGMPLVIAETILWLRQQKRIKWESLAGLVKALFLLAAMLLGFLLYQRILIPAYGGPIQSTSSLASLGVFLDGLIHLPYRLLQVFGGFVDFADGFSVRSLLGILMLFFSGFGFYLIVHFRKATDKLQKQFWVFAFSQSVLNILVLLLVIQNSNVGNLPTRYVALGTIALFPCLAMALGKASMLRYVVRFYLVAMLLCADAVYVLEVEHVSSAPNERTAYIEFLTSNGYRQGESTFWNADITTALSNGTISMKPVQNDAALTYFPWLTPKYTRDMEIDFLLLDKGEDAVRRENGNSTAGEVVYEDTKYIIYSTCRPMTASE